MRAHLRTLVCLFVPAYLDAITWILAGCGWGLIVGCILETAFGRGADGLLDAAGETSLEAVAGALCGLAGGTLTLGVLHLVTLVPIASVMGWLGGRFANGDASRGIMQERSARAGAVAAILCAVINGTYMFPMLGAALVLESVNGPTVPHTPLEGATLAGILAGGIIGLITLLRGAWQRLPQTWREEFLRDDSMHGFFRRLDRPRDKHEESLHADAS
jgi:hypothetical protein